MAQKGDPRKRGVVFDSLEMKTVEQGRRCNFRRYRNGGLDLLDGKPVPFNFGPPAAVNTLGGQEELLQPPDAPIAAVTI